MARRLDPPSAAVAALLALGCAPGAPARPVAQSLAAVRGQTRAPAPPARHCRNAACKPHAPLPARHSPAAPPPSVPAPSGSAPHRQPPRAAPVLKGCKVGAEVDPTKIDDAVRGSFSKAGAQGPRSRRGGGLQRQAEATRAHARVQDEGRRATPHARYAPVSRGRRQPAV